MSVVYDQNQNASPTASAILTSNPVSATIMPEEVQVSINKEISALKLSGIRVDNTEEFYNEILKESKPYKCYISFPVECCKACPHRNECNPHIHKQTASLNISRKGRNRARYQRVMQEKIFKAFCRLRNGVETIPSNLRKNFHIDKLPRGKQRGKFFFGSKIAALNFRKLFNFRKGSIKCAQNPVFA